MGHDDILVHSWVCQRTSPKSRFYQNPSPFRLFVGLCLKSLLWIENVVLKFNVGRHRCYLSFTISLFGDVFEQCIDNRFNFLTLEWQELKFIISLRMSVNFWRIRQIKCQSNTTRLLPTIIGFNPPPSHPSLQWLFQANAFRQRGPGKWHFRR